MPIKLKAGLVKGPFSSGMHMKSLATLSRSVLLGFLSVSCALVAPQKKIELADLTPEQIERLNRESLSLASSKLEHMVAQTNASSNKAAVNFLATDLFLKANLSLLEGDFLTASVLFKHVVDLAPQDDFVQKKYAISLIRVGDLETAESVLEKLYARSNDEKVGLILAGVYSGTDKESKAREVYHKLLAQNPKNEDACVFLGKSLAVSKETAKAISLLQSCAHKDPKSGMYDYYIGKIHIDQGKLPEAVAAFKKAHDRQPTLSQAANALGVIYEEREQFEAATALYEKHLKKAPQDQAILSRMVQVLFLKEKYAEVIPYAERLSDLDPDNLNLKVKLGILYTDAKKYPEAISVFKDLLQVAPQSDKILYYLGAIYQDMNKLEESIEYFNQIPSSSGLYTDSSVQMANMLSTLAQQEYHKGEEQKWKDTFISTVNKKIEELKDMRVEFSVVKAGFYEGTSQYKEAMEAMMVIQDEKNFSVQHKYYLANLYEKEKRYSESTSLIMSIIEKEPKNAHAWNFLGYSLLVRGDDMDKAFEYIQTALKINPDDGYIRDSLGWYYFKTGNVKKALSELELAFKKVPNDVEILKHLATVHRELKDFSKAKTFFESALKHARFHSDRKEILTFIEDLKGDRLPASGILD